MNQENKNVGRPMFLILALLIVFQLNYSTGSPAALPSSADNTSSDSPTITSSVAPTSSSSSSGSSSTPTGTTTDEVPELTTPRRPNYSSLRETIPGLPENCASYEVQDEQPKFTNQSSWKKCCPEGRVLTEDKTCVAIAESEAIAFRPPIINATFFTDCIEDSETIDFLMRPLVYMPQNQSMLYDEGDYGDHLYILQNGSLLIVYENMETGFGVFSDYCLDINPKTHTFFALVYSPEMHREIQTGVVLGKFYKGIAIIMVTSFICLVITSALYMCVPRLRTLHGRSFSLHGMNLALGYIIIASTYFKWEGNQKSPMEGNAWLQYFVSAAFMWQFTMCVDTLINVWYYIPRKISPIEGKYRGWIHFGCYVAVSQLVPLFFIIHHDESSTTVNYYMSTLGEENHDDQWLFFGPILFIILLCVGMFVATYYGFRKLNSIQSLAYIIRMKLRRQKREDEVPLPYCSKEMEYVKDSARATCFLFGIQSLCFLSELITFYITNSSSIFFELMNAMQGWFILVLFVLFPKKLEIIRQCWAGDQGSLVIDQPARRPVATVTKEQELEEVVPLKEKA